MEPISEKELKEIRYLFPVTKKLIYLNHAAVAPISLRVADAIVRYNQEALNQGYTAGPTWVKRFEEIRHRCADLIGANPDEIAFVKNTSHGVSLVARGLDLKAGDEIIISELEFPTNVYPWMALETRGVVVKKIPADDGRLHLESLEKLATDQTQLVSLSSVQFGSGFRLPLERIGSWCRERGILFMVDAIQSLGAFPIDVHREQVDFLAADAHKWMLCHEGIGIFYIRRELIERIEPTLIGWNSVEGALNFDVIDYQLKETAARFEEGSHNGICIYGLGAAVDLLLEVGVERIADRLHKLTEQLIEGLVGMGFEILSPIEPEIRSGIVLAAFPEDPQSLRLNALERHLFAKDIYCTLRSGGIRFSPHFYNTEEEIDETLNEIKNFLEKKA